MRCRQEYAGFPRESRTGFLRNAAERPAPRGCLTTTSQPNYNPAAHVLSGVPAMASKKKHMTSQAAGALLLVFVLVAGCIASHSSPPDTPQPLQTPDTPPAITSAPAAIPVTSAAPVTTATALLPQTAPARAADTITENLPYGITLSHPPDWVLEETGVPVTRDYGREVISIANLFSPEIPPWRRMAGNNPDPSDHTILTVDVDENGGTDLEGYFNRATVALQRGYGSIDITRHNFQLSIAGSRAYRLDFDAKDLRGTYIFTRAGGRVYIFSFSNPTPFSSEIEEMVRSIALAP